MSDTQDKRDPREDHIAIVADARGPISVEIMFTRRELVYLLSMILASHLGDSYERDEELEQSIRIKLQKLLKGGAR